jgi:hypothetical protein
MLHPATQSVLLREIHGLPSTVVTTEPSMMEDQSRAIDLHGEDRRIIRQTIEGAANKRTNRSKTALEYETERSEMVSRTRKRISDASQCVKQRANHS